MPYLRIIGINKIREVLWSIRDEYVKLINGKVYSNYMVSVLLMYLFSVIEDIVALHVRDTVVTMKKPDEDGVLVKYSVFLGYARQFHLLDGLPDSALYSVVGVRNKIAHDFKKASKPFNVVLSGVSATYCAKLFKNAFDSVDMDNETRLLCNELLYDLFRRDGLQLSREFEQWIAAENAILMEGR